MADCAAIKAELDAAKAAYVRLTEGGAPRVVQDVDGSRVEYTAANAGRLYNRIALLEAQYAACTAGTMARMTRPINFVFR